MNVLKLMSAASHIEDYGGHNSFTLYPNQSRRHGGALVGLAPLKKY